MTDEYLRRLAEKATPQDIDSAEQVAKNDHFNCPLCDGTGEVDGATYTNYDGHALGVQFFGIGHEHVHAEAFFRACTPAKILSLLDRLKAAEANQRTPGTVEVCEDYMIWPCADNEESYQKRSDCRSKDCPFRPKNTP